MAGSAQAALNKFADWGPLQPTQSPPVLVVPVSTISLPCKLGCSLGPQLNLNGVGSIGYSLSSSNLSTDAANAPSGLHVFPVVSDVEVSTLWYADTLTFNKFTSNIRAVGFNLFGADGSGQLAALDLTITATDISGLSLTTTSPGSSTNDFVGFASDVALASVVISAKTPTAGRYVTIENIAISAVPEPSTWLLMLAGGLSASALAAFRKICSRCERV